jgi:hypothetical protein
MHDLEVITAYLMQCLAELGLDETNYEEMRSIIQMQTLHPNKYGILWKHDSHACIKATNAQGRGFTFLAVINLSKIRAYNSPAAGREKTAIWLDPADPEFLKHLQQYMSDTEENCE